MLKKLIDAIEKDNVAEFITNKPNCLHPNNLNPAVVKAVDGGYLYR